MSKPDLVEIKESGLQGPRARPSTSTASTQRTRTRRPDFVYEVVRIVMSLMAWIFFRARGYHPERVPAAGPVILAPNHFSFLDHFFLGVALRRKVQFMAKSQLFKPPMQWIYTHGGVFPVRRGFADEEAFITAVSVLDRGGTVAMYAEGGRSRTGELSARSRGAGSAASRCSAARRSSRWPSTAPRHVRNWKRLQFPKVRVLYGDPIAYERVEAPTRDQEQAAADAIFAEVRALYDAAPRPRSARPERLVSARGLPGTSRASSAPDGEHRGADPDRARHAVA